MAYVDVLSPNPNGKTVVLLHGKNFNIAYWEQTIKELSKQGFRVIAPDQIGFGNQPSLQATNTAFSSWLLTPNQFSTV